MSILKEIIAKKISEVENDKKKNSLENIKNNIKKKKTLVLKSN